MDKTIIRRSLYFTPFTDFFFLFLPYCTALKNETDVHDRVTPENIRSAVIQTTCSARKQLTLAFASSFKCGAVKNEQNLFIQRSAWKNSTVPEGCQMASIKKNNNKKTRAPVAKGICFSFCFNSVTNST